MSVALLINLAYIVAAVLFILGLKMLSSPATARKRQPGLRGRHAASPSWRRCSTSRSSITGWIVDRRCRRHRWSARIAARTVADDRRCPRWSRCSTASAASPACWSAGPRCYAPTSDLHPDHDRAVDPDRRRDLHRQRGRLGQAQRDHQRQALPVRRPAHRQRPARWRRSWPARVLFCMQPGTNYRATCTSIVALSFAARRDGGDPDRRRRHAGGDLAAEQLLGPRGLRGRLRDQQHDPDRRRRAGRRQRHHPDADHVQGHEPLARQRAVQRIRRGRAAPAEKLEGEVKAITHEDAYYVLEAAVQRGDRARLRHGRRAGAARRPRTAGTAREERRRGASTRSTRWPGACPGT